MIASGRPRATFAIVSLALALIASTPSFADAGATDVHEESTPGVIARINTWRLEWIAETDAWLHAGPLGAYVNLQDTRMSPLVYAGPGVGFALGADVVRARWLSPHSLVFRYATPSGTDALPARYQSVSGEGDVALLYRLPRSGFAAGGGVRSGAHLRIYDKLQNNTYNSDVTVALNATGRWELPFAFLSRSMAFHARADLPLVSWINRSPAFGAFGSASFWAPPTRYFRVTIDTGLTSTLRWASDNTVRLRYLWDFYAMSEFDGLHTLRIATHTLVLSLGTRTM